MDGVFWAVTLTAFLRLRDVPIRQPGADTHAILNLALQFSRSCNDYPAAVPSWRVTSALGQFRPIQRGFAMSDHPPEADIGTAGIYEYTPQGAHNGCLDCRTRLPRASAGACPQRQRDHALAGATATVCASLTSTNRSGTFRARSRNHASATMIAMPPTLTSSCINMPWEY